MSEIIEEENKKTIENDDNESIEKELNDNVGNVYHNNYDVDLDYSARENNNLNNYGKKGGLNYQDSQILFNNFDVQSLAYSIVKDYSQLKISKDEKFMERMKFDIYKRQIKEAKINKIIEENKIKLNESERIKTFNRLIEDANRRVETKEKMEEIRNKSCQDLREKPKKKYKDKDWNKIYKERFANYKAVVDRKHMQLIKEKKAIEKQEEDEEVKMCKIKKGSKQLIDKTTQRLFGEAVKRKIKKEEMESNKSIRKEKEKPFENSLR